MTFPAYERLVQKITREVTSVFLHTKKLLRLRNQLCSPLLRVPTEILVHIISFVMDELDSFPRRRVWVPIYSTCYHIHNTMRTAKDLWWMVDCTDCGSADFIFNHSNGAPQVLYSNIYSDNGGHPPAEIERLLDTWKDGLKFKGHRLHTIEYCGPHSSFPHFSWILERPLPRLQDLTINIVDSLDDEWMETPSDPVPLELSMDAPLQILNLRNATLPWSSLCGLHQLHLSFTDFDHIVTIPEDELFAMFDASPQLERLSLLQVGHKVPVSNGRPISPKRTIRFPNLTSLKLDNTPTVVMYTLAYMELPVINSLQIRSLIAPDLTQTPTSLFIPDDRLPARLFLDPPIFAVGSTTMEGQSNTFGVSIGGFKLCLDFSPDQAGRGGEAVMSYIGQVAPPSITCLCVDDTHLEEREWRDFFRSHPAVRSIYCTTFWDLPWPLWEALSPPGEDKAVLCPNLESISIMTLSGQPLSFAPLADCLRSRQNSGFRLGCLVIQCNEKRGPNGFREEFYPLAETVRITTTPESTLLVSPRPNL